MKEHMENGLILAKFLETSPLVEKVIHPCLPSHPQHEIAMKQQYGHSGMITFYLKGNPSIFYFNQYELVISFSIHLNSKYKQ